MKYLLDTHSLSDNLMARSSKRNDLFVIQEVVEEYVYSQEDDAKFRESAIKVIELEHKHFKKLQEILSVHGDNYSLIRLYTGKGTADVLMLAYVVAEIEAPETLFEEDYRIITKDKTLIEVAKTYGIKCIDTL